MNIMTFKDFQESSSPVNKATNHPPSNPTQRYLWENCILYSVIDKLEDGCTILDYGCGGNNSPLKDNLFSRYDDCFYYGLDHISVITRTDTESYSLRPLDEFKTLCADVDAVVCGSVFTHLDWEHIKEVLDSCSPLFENGGQLGFSTFLGEVYCTQKPNYYFAQQFTYGQVIVPVEYYENYCENRGLHFEVLDHYFPLEIPGTINCKSRNVKLDRQDFCTIYKK